MPVEEMKVSLKSDKNTYCFSTTTMVTRRRLIFRCMYIVCLLHMPSHILVHPVRYRPGQLEILLSCLR